MGEQSDRVIVSGAPSLDNLKSLKLFTRQELERDLNIPFNNAPAVCTFHPVTTDFKSAKTHIENLLDALDEMNSPVIFTASNADTGSRIIMDLVKAYVSKKKNAYLVDNLGTLKYFSLMQAASFMIGNSSSGIIEAASFKLPVINIGTRQNGRIFPPNVINTDHDKMSIINAIKTVSSPDFKETISKANNPYGNGSASKIIVSGIMDFLDRNCSSIKHFNDLNCSTR